MLLLTVVLVAMLALDASESVRAKSSGCGSNCDDEDSPVCGTDGVTYLNFCLYMNAACANKTLSLAATDACPGYVPHSALRQRHSGATTTDTTTSTSSCNIVCATGDYSPVCASDGQTYNSPCQFTIARCQRKGHLWVVDYKPCSQVNTVRRTCGLGKRCTSSQLCLMELESTDKFCVDSCASVLCAMDKVCLLQRSICTAQPCSPQPTCVADDSS